MRFTRTSGSLLGVAVLLAGVVVVAQPGEDGAVQMRTHITEQVLGTVVSADAANGVIDADSRDHGVVKLYVSPPTRLLKLEKMDAKDLRIGDRLEVRGSPARIVARSLTADRSAPPPGPAPGEPGFGMTGTVVMSFSAVPAVLTGTVIALDPLKVRSEFPAFEDSNEGVEVQVDIPEDAEVSRVVDAKWDDVVKGVPFSAQVTSTDDDPRLVVDEIRLGDTVERRVMRHTSPTGGIRMSPR